MKPTYEELEAQLEAVRHQRDTFDAMCAELQAERERLRAEADAYRTAVAELRAELNGWDSGEGPSRAAAILAILDRR